jgi:formate hydrogenlyase subunit 3/multisubunit Na+/H+ antiporter MnhD subunit
VTDVQISRQDFRKNLGTIALVVVLIAIMAGALWYAASAWTVLSGPPMPTVGYVAMGFGVLFSLIIGCGLMALLFYSSRHGYDEQQPIDRDGEQQ